MLAVAKLSGDSIRIPRAAAGARSRVLAFFNIAGWNGLVLFGVQQLPAGRSAIIAYTMPIWSVLFALALLHEPLSKRKIAGLALGMVGHGAAAGRRHPQHPAHADRRAADPRRGGRRGRSAPCCCASGSRRSPQNTLSGWMMLLGWLPLAVLAPFFAHRAARARPSSGARGSRSSTTSSSPARSRTGRGSRSRARCRSRCRRCRRCRCRSSACSPACCCWASGRGRRSGWRWRSSSRRWSRCCGRRSRTPGARSCGAGTAAGTGS